MGRFIAKKHLKIISKIDYPVACSYTINNILKKEHKLSSAVIQNSANEELFEINKNKNELREKLNMDKEKIYFVSVGYLIKRKNPLFIVSAFNKVKSNKYKLLILGDGVLKKECEKYKNENIEFRGFVNNVNEYLMASDVFVSASKSEGLPTVVLEAMGSNLFLLLSDIPQHKEILTVEDKFGKIFSLKVMSLNYQKCYREKVSGN